MTQIERHEHRSCTRWQVERQARLKLEGAQAFAECRVKDINFKGAQICLGQKLQKDTFLKLNLCLTEDCSIEAEVWVVWHKRIVDINGYGLYFTKMKDADKEKIYKFMRKHFPQQLYQQWWKGLSTEKGGEKMEDRRIFSRFKIGLPVKFLDLGKNKEGAAQAQDVCAKGMGLVINEELAARTPLEMWLEIPDKGEPLYVRGEVVWSKRIEPNRYRSGISLEKADLMGLSRILRVI